MLGKNPTTTEQESPDSGVSASPGAPGDESLVFFGSVADGIVRSLRPRRVFDTGGLLVEALRDRGVEARGPDRSITEPFQGRFDLSACIGVLEHLSEQEVRGAMERISRASDVVLVSSAGWLRLFAEHGFEPDLKYDAGFVGPNAILFRRRAPETVDRIALLEAEAALERRRSTQLASTVSELKGRLQAIQESPGWRLVARYRNWLRAARTRHRVVRRWFEPTAARLLRGLAPTRPMAESPPRVLAAKSSTQYEDWIPLEEPSPAELNLQRQRGAELAWRPKFSVLVPVYKVSQAVLATMVESVLSQTYDHWELCIVHGDPANTAGREYLSWLAASDARIKLELLESNLGISGNSNRTLLQCEGDFVALLDHDDTLAPFALFEVAQRLNEDPALDFIYSDKDHLSEDGTHRTEPVFKPGWAPDRLLSANYLTHLCVIRTAIVREVGGWRSETDGAQDWDLFLRAIAKSPRIAHIPKILYHWRRVSTSVAAHGLKAKPYARAAQLEVIRLSLKERGWKARPVFSAEDLIRLKWNRKHRPRATLLVLSTKPSIRAVKHTGVYPGLEVVRVLCKENASPASLLNDAVRRSSGDVFVFLDEGVEPATDMWLDELIAPLEEPGAGITGAKLFDKETGRILHAGICFNPDGEIAYPFTGDPGYPHEALFSGDDWYNNWLAVSGACFGIRREVFERVGGFSEEPMFPRLDVDLCLKVALDAGQRVLYNPFARMWKDGPAILETWVREDGAAEGAQYIRSSFPEGDPFFSPKLVCKEGRIVLRRLFDAPPPSASGHNDTTEASVMAKAYDVVPAEFKVSKSSWPRNGAATNHFMWFLPEFRRVFATGVDSALRFADSFRRHHGIRSTFVVSGRTHPARIKERIARAFPELAAASSVHVIDGGSNVSGLEASDAAIATGWTTAYSILRYNQARQKFYLLQDDESLLYPAGSVRGLVEATWGFGFRGICVTETLRDLYTARGGEAGFFTPCVDREFFFSRSAGESNEERPYTLCCHVQPNDSRTGFELVVEAIRILKRRLGDKVTVVTAAEPWVPEDFGIHGLMHNLGPIGHRATGALYRSCDVAVMMSSMAQAHDRALELMACGSLVVAGENPRMTWLLRNNDTCLLSPGTPSALAEALEEGLCNIALRRRITGRAGRMVREQYQDWDRSAETVFRYVCGHLAAAGS